MTPINRLGLLAAMVVVLIAAGGYGIWRGTAFLLQSHRTVSKPTPSLSPAIADAVQKDITAVSNQAGENLRTKLVQQLNASDSYTAKYLATLPTSLPQAQVLDKTRIEAFVDQNQGQLLPIIAPETIKTTADQGKTAIKAYLDGISSATNPAIKSITSDDIQKAYQAFYADPQHSTALADVKTTLQGNFDALKGIPTPSEAVSIQTKLLAASQALTTNVGLLETMPKDLVGGLLAAKNIQDLGPVFAGIQTDIDVLQKKYGL